MTLSSRRYHAAAGLLCVLYALLVHGAVDTMYQQYRQYGEPDRLMVDVPPASSAPADAPARSHLGYMTYFWSEDAFHFRTALMFAVDHYQPPALLKSDWWQQYPDGVDAWAEYALFMEPIYGTGYRLFGGRTPFADYILLVVSVVAALTLAGVYATGFVATRSARCALAGALVYATCTLGFSRLLVGALLKETLGFAILAWTLTAWVRVLRGGGWAARIGAWSGTVALLAAWHFGQFIVLMLTAALFASAVWGRAAAATGRGADRATPPAILGTAFLVAGTAVPALRSNGALLGLPAILALSWWAADLAGRRAQALRRPAAATATTLGLALVVFAVAALSGARHESEFGHVYQFVLARLTYPFGKPADPRELPFAARVFWSAPFTAPTPRLVWLRLGLNGLVLVPAGFVLVGRTLRTGRSAVGILLGGFTLVTLVAWLFADRFGPLFLVPAAAAVAVLTAKPEPAPGLRETSPRRPWWLAIVVVLALVNIEVNLRRLVVASSYALSGRTVKLVGLDDRENRCRSDMYRWITEHTPGPGSDREGRPAAFVGDIGDSPQLLLYAGRPIVLNSQFENAAIRERYRQYLESVFARDETLLWRFMDRYKADYVFIRNAWGLSEGTGSALYLSGVATRLDPDMTAVKMVRAPERLARFDMVYANELYRVFRRR